jgi:hypothetical protein
MGGAVLAGLGMVLLFLAAFRFRARSVPYLVEESPTDSSSE